MAHRGAGGFIGLSLPAAPYRRRQRMVAVTLCRRRAKLDLPTENQCGLVDDNQEVESYI